MCHVMRGLVGSCLGLTSVGRETDRGTPFTPEAFEVIAYRFGPNSDVIQCVLLKVLPFDGIVLIRDGRGLSTTQEKTTLLLLCVLCVYCVCIVCVLCVNCDTVCLL